QSGNPAGKKPHEITMTGVLKSKIDKGWAADQLIELAKGGDLAALKYIYDRVDGKPTESMELTGAGGGPVETVIYVDKALENV
ncbi:unnamed protein product, partial [marine sediment metagenome]